jgi:MYXO-CTERM domain-containing protein
MSMRLMTAFVAVLLTALLTTAASAAPLVDVDITGTAGDWTLDFSVENTLGGTNAIYFFGVQMLEHDVAASPTGWDPDYNPTWSTAADGGSSTVYNNVWITPDPIPDIPPGATLSGFVVHSDAANLPASIPWFAFSEGGIYTGTDHFYTSENPGFEGVVTTPEPAALALVSLGGLALLRRRRA